MRTLTVLFLLLSFLYISGCAEITPPSPKDIISKPLGTSSVKLGMTKYQVKEIWGEPNQINYVRDKEKWGGEREEWIYTAKYSPIPIDAGHLSKTKKLYFDGDSLTNIVED